MTGLEVVELGPLGEGSVREKGQLGQGWNLACSSLRSMLRSPPRACGRLALHGGQRGEEEGPAGVSMPCVWWEAWWSGAARGQKAGPAGAGAHEREGATAAIYSPDTRPGGHQLIWCSGLLLQHPFWPPQEESGLHNQSLSSQQPQYTQEQALGAGSPPRSLGGPLTPQVFPRPPSQAPSKHIPLRPYSPSPFPLGIHLCSRMSEDSSCSFRSSATSTAPSPLPRSCSLSRMSQALAELVPAFLRLSVSDQSSSSLSSSYWWTRFIICTQRLLTASPLEWLWGLVDIGRGMRPSGPGWAESPWSRVCWFMRGSVGRGCFAWACRGVSALGAWDVERLSQEGQEWTR